MENNTDKIFSEILSLIADFIPPIAPIVHTLQFPATVSDAISTYKLKKLLGNQNPNLTQLLQIEWKFDTCRKEYAENMRKLIYLLNAMHEDKSIDVYANLLRSYQLGFLNCDDFFRLSWVVAQAYFNDLQLLQKLYYHRLTNQEYMKLSVFDPYGLTDKVSKVSYNKGALANYSLNNLGKKMIACGLDFENYDKYKSNLELSPKF